jgi:death-on-curing protein
MTDPGWRWVAMEVVLAIHDEQVAEHGGMTGIRDLGLLESALAHPPNLANYGDPDLADLAATYAYGIARNHPFVDGNKRTAFVVAYVFLLDHGYDLGAGDAEAVEAMLALAAGEVEETAPGDWFRVNLVVLPAS